MLLRLVSAYELDVEKLVHQFLLRKGNVHNLEAGGFETSVRSEGKNRRLVLQQFEFIYMCEKYFGTYEKMDEMPVGVPYECIHAAVYEDFDLVVQVP